MNERLFVPKRYSQEYAKSPDASREQQASLRPIFFDPLSRDDMHALTKTLRAAQGKKLVLPGNIFQERTRRQAQQKGIYHDTMDVFAEDLLNLGVPKGYYDDKPDELKRYIKEMDDPEMYMYVRFPWQDGRNTFKIPRKPLYKQITQSRETGITSPKTQKALENTRIGIGGGGVGTWVGLSFVRAGAEHVAVADGSVIKPHRGNRTPGDFVSVLGENQAAYFAKKAYNDNPYGDYTAIQQPLGLPHNNPGAYPLSQFVEQSNFIFDEIDDLRVKAQMRLIARELHVPVAQITDIGNRVAVQFDDPNFEAWPCGGRLTPDVFQELMHADLTNFDTFSDYAINVFMGKKNIPPDVHVAFVMSRDKGYFHIPQSGRAASQAGPAAIQLFSDYVEGIVQAQFEK